MLWCMGVVAAVATTVGQGDAWLRAHEPGCTVQMAQQIGMGSSADEIAASVIAAIRAEEEREQPDEAVRQRLYSVLAWATNGARASDGGIVIDNVQQIEQLAHGLEVESSMIRLEILKTVERVEPGRRALLADGLAACLRDPVHSVVKKAADVIRYVGVANDAGREMLWQLASRPAEANASAWKSLEEWRETVGDIGGYDGRVLYRVYAIGARMSCGQFDVDVVRWSELDEEGQQAAVLALAAHLISGHAPALSDEQQVRALQFVGRYLRTRASAIATTDAHIVWYFDNVARSVGAEARVRDALLECMATARAAEGFEEHAEAIREIELVVGRE